MRVLAVTPDAKTYVLLFGAENGEEEPSMKIRQSGRPAKKILIVDDEETYAF